MASDEAGDSLIWLMGPAENIAPSLPVVAEDAARLRELVELVEVGLRWASAQMRGDIPTELAAVAGLARAVQGVRAAAMLCMHGFYTESRVMIRSAYEAAALARTLAHDGPTAERWLRKAAVVPDKVSRDYAKAMSPEGDGDVAHREYYKRASTMAHPAAVSTLPYVFPKTGPAGPQMTPAFDEAECRVVMREVVAEASLIGYTFRNSFARREDVPVAWRRRLAELSAELVGGDLADLEQDWDERERRHAQMCEQILTDAEATELTRAHPNSAEHRYRRSQEPPN